MKPRRFSAFPYSGEADMLFCHLYEVGDIMDGFIIVEADVTHGDNRPKPYYYLEQQDRFARWADKITYVQATNLPDDPADAWGREIAQREWTRVGLEQVDAQPNDILFYGDVDEIPKRLVARHAKPMQMMVLAMRFHPFAVDWLHPNAWPGVVVGPVRGISSFMSMRALRGTLIEDPARRQVLWDAGWHLSWVTASLDEKQDKLNTFCHPEIRPAWEDHLDDCYETGIHVDGAPLEAVDVTDGEWPRWITEGHAPPGWFRPRDVTRERPRIEPIPAKAPPSVLLPVIR